MGSLYGAGQGTLPHHCFHLIAPVIHYRVLKRATAPTPVTVSKAKD